MKKWKVFFDFLSELKQRIGKTDMDSLYNLLADYRETFKILGELLNNDALK